MEHRAANLGAGEGGGLFAEAGELGAEIRVIQPPVEGAPSDVGFAGGRGVVRRVGDDREGGNLAWREVWREVTGIEMCAIVCISGDSLLAAAFSGAMRGWSGDSVSAAAFAGVMRGAGTRRREAFRRLEMGPLELSVTGQDSGPRGPLYSMVGGCHEAWQGAKVSNFVRTGLGGGDGARLTAAVRRPEFAILGARP